MQPIVKSPLVLAFVVTLFSLSMGRTNLADENSKASSNADVVMNYVGDHFDASNGLKLPYRMFEPMISNGTSRLPLLVFLHGAGERGTDNTKQLKHGAKVFTSQEFQSNHPCFVIAPQCREEHLWCNVPWTTESVQQPKEPSEELAAVFELIDHLRTTRAIDAKRIYITGLSMGGFGTWDAISRRPNFFAAAVPICGGGDVTNAKLLTKLPIWCYHGDADNVVRVELSRNMIEAIQKAGGTPRYTEYPGVAHDSWTATYADQSLFAWLFKQSK